MLTADAEMKKAMAQLKEEMDGNHLGHRAALKNLATAYKDIQASLAGHNPDLKKALRDAIILIGVSISGHSRDPLLSVLKEAELKLDANLRSQMLNAYHHIFRDVPPAFKSVSDQRAGWRGKRRRKRHQAPEEALDGNRTAGATADSAYQYKLQVAIHNTSGMFSRIRVALDDALVTHSLGAAIEQITSNRNPPTHL